jgi:hypothetical protein
MERYCSTGQSPQRAVAPKEKKETRKEKYTRKVTNFFFFFFAKVHIVFFIPQWSAICVNVEECDYHLNIFSPVLLRVVFFSPTSARTDALHSIKAEEENVVPPTSRAVLCTSTFLLSLLSNSARRFDRQCKV